MDGWGYHLIFEYSMLRPNRQQTLPLYWELIAITHLIPRDSAQQKHSLERDLEKVLRIWPLKMKKAHFLVIVELLYFVSKMA